MSAPDVMVIGAGIVGCSIALELSGRGAKVTLLERAVPGAARAGGQKYAPDTYGAWMGMNDDEGGDA